MKTKESNVNSVQCTLCKYVVTFVDNYIENNRSQAAVEAALEKVCEILPPALNKSCVQFVETFGPVLFQYIEKHGSPDAVCNALQMCHNGTEEVSSFGRIEPSELTVNSPQCTLCEFVLGYIEKQIGNNRSAAAIEAALDKVCNILPSPVKSNCTDFVNKFGPIIAILLAKNSTPAEICDFLKLCNNGTQVVSSDKPAVKLNFEQSADNSLECSLCKYIVGYIDTIIQNNKSEAAIEAALEKVCTILPHALNKSCVEFIENYGPILVQLLEKYTTPDQVCAALKVCTNGTEVVSADKPVASFNVKESNINSVQCTLCKYVVTFVDNYIENNRSQAAVEAALEKVCEILPPALNKSCVQFVETFGPVLFQYIEKHGSPDAVCNALQMCHNGTEEIPSRKTEDVIKVEKTPVNSLECSLCKYIVGYVDAVIQSNKSEAAIEAALEKVCTVLPHSLNASCVQFVENYGPVLVQLIEKYGRPEDVCNAIKICHNGTVAGAAVQSKQSSVGSPQCSLCKLVVHYLDLVIQNNKSEAAIVDALEKICTIVPSSDKDKCEAFIKTYGSELVELLEKLGTPDLVCMALGLCVKDTQEIPVAVETKKSVNNPVECSICKYVVGYVDAVIQTNKSEAAIDAALEKVCTILPHSLNHTCYQFVDEYGPELVELIAKYATPSEVCAALKLCTNGSIIIQKPIESKKSIKNDAECTLCKYVINYINLLLESNATEQEIAKGLEVVCSLLPSSDRQKCASFVQTYGPILPQLIAELDDPNVVCEWLQFCPKSNDTFIQIPAIKHDNVNSLPCNICQYLVNYLDAIIKSNSTETKFDEALERACKILPGDKLQSECKIFVDLYGADLINLLVEFGNPKTVCQELGICDK